MRKAEPGWTMSMMVRNASVLVVALALSAGVLSGCGSDEASTTQSNASATAAWVNDFCGSIATWRSDLRTARQTLMGNVSKAGLQSAADDISAANTALGESLSGLGEPPTPTADEAKADVEQLATDLKDEGAKIREAASTSSDVLSTASSITSSLKTMRDEIRSTVTKLESLEDDSEWKQAFAESQSCSALTNR